eukprot:INCI7673.2.p1 GENE.INCI7673.2~~INCI7673.2.p1  ORF type:complete len:1390 (+),score=182.70 INCI7673.2:118-4287(+)
MGAASSVVNPKHLLGNDYFKKGQYVQAIHSYTAALLASQDVRLFSNRALCYLRLRMYSAALQDALHAVLIAPAWPKSYLRVGQIFAELGAASHAEKYLQDALCCTYIATDPSRSFSKAKASAPLRESVTVQKGVAEVQALLQKCQQQMRTSHHALRERRFVTQSDIGRCCSDVTWWDTHIVDGQAWEERDFWLPVGDGPVQVIAVGVVFSVVVAENGKTFVIENSSGPPGSKHRGIAPQDLAQLSLGDTIEVPVLLPIFLGLQVISISAGLAHCVLVAKAPAGGNATSRIGVNPSSTTTQVWSWGLNTFGALGLGDNMLRPRPCRVHAVQEYRSVNASGPPLFIPLLGGGSVSFSAAFCTQSGSFLLDKATGRVWATGSNRFGALGLGSAPWTSSFTPVYSLNDGTTPTFVKQIACGFNHTIFLDREGGMLTCGSNVSGQLGLGMSEPQLLQCRKITRCQVQRELKRDLQASTDVTYDTNGSLIGEELRSILEPVTHIAAGGDYSFCVMQNTGTVYAWGDNSHGQLCVGDLSDRSFPTQVLCLQHRCIQEIALTMKAGIALNDGPSVYFTGVSPSFAEERGGKVRTLNRRREGISDSFLHQSEVPTGNHSDSTSVFSGPFQIAFLSSYIDEDHSSFRWIQETKVSANHSAQLKQSPSIWRALSAAVCGNLADQDPGYIVEAGTTAKFSIVSGLDDGNQFRNPRLGDETSVWSVLAFSTPFYFDPECELQRFEPSTGSTCDVRRVVIPTSDNGNGEHIGSIYCPIAGNISLHVMTRHGQHIVGSPFHVTVLPASYCPEKCVVLATHFSPDFQPTAPFLVSKFRKQRNIATKASSAEGHALSNVTAFDWKSDLSFHPTVHCVLRDDWFNIVPIEATDVVFSLAISIYDADKTGDIDTQSPSWVKSHILSEKITSKLLPSSTKTNVIDTFVEGTNVLAWKLQLIKPLERSMVLCARVMAHLPNDVSSTPIGSVVKIMLLSGLASRLRLALEPTTSHVISAGCPVSFQAAALDRRGSFTANCASGRILQHLVEGSSGPLSATFLLTESETDSVIFDSAAVSVSGSPTPLAARRNGQQFLFQLTFLRAGVIYLKSRCACRDDVTQRHSDHGECASSPLLVFHVAPAKARTCRFVFQTEGDDKSTDIVPISAGLRRAFGNLLRPDFHAVPVDSIGSDSFARRMGNISFTVHCFDEFNNACNSGDGNNVKLIIGPSGHEDDTKTTGLTSEVINLHDGSFFCSITFPNSNVPREYDWNLDINGHDSLASPALLHVPAIISKENDAQSSSAAPAVVMADALRAEQTAAEKELSKRQAVEEAVMAEKERLRSEEDRLRREYEEKMAAEEAAKQLEQEKLRRQEATRRRAKEAHNIGRNSVVAYSFADAVLSFLQSIFAW